MEDGVRKTQSYIYKLTPASRRLYRELVNPENFDLTVSELCDKAKVSRNTYYQRMKDEAFVNSVKAEQRRQVESKIGNVLNATYKYAMTEKGHQDRKMLLTWAGEYTDKLESKIEGEVDISGTSSILQKYLKDDGEDSLSGDEDGG